MENKREGISHYIHLIIRWLDIYKWRISIGVLLIIISILLATETFWFLAAIDSLRIVYAVFLVAVITLFFIKGNNTITSAAVIALLILSPGIWPYFKPSDETPSQRKEEKKEVVDADFTVLHFNVKENNKHISSVAEAALKADADIVSMQELKETSLQVIDTMLRKQYPFVLSDISIKGFGMAVYSKFPIEQTAVVVEHDFPLLTGKIKTPKGEMRFIAVTTSTPTNDKGYEQQMKQFKFIAAYADTITSPLIIMGDMNSVPWSEQIKTLMITTGVEDSRKDLSATYPAQSPLQIPIDYIFHSRDLFCEKFSTVGGTTSNHLGIMGYYSFHKKKEKEDINKMLR